MTGRSYCLSPGVRARREAFGLLFYNSRDAKLTYLKSGDLFHVVPDLQGASGLAVCCSDSIGDAKLERLVDLMRKRGLIV